MASDDDDAYLYSDEEPAPKKARLEKEPEPEGPADELSGSGSDSDDDVEFLIEDPTASRPSTTPQVASEAAEPDATVESATKKSTRVQKDDGLATIDINAVAEYDGKPLTQLDLDTLKEKPWRAPGADISDYFNYGFDEFTWTAYCHKQDATRGDFNPQKVMAKMMSGPGGKGVFPFPFMPMPNMPNMPNMPMPNMPNMPNMPMPNMPMPPMPSGPKKPQQRGGRRGRK